VRVFTCLKEVASRETRFQINEEESWIKSRDLTYEMNECDEYSIEEALRIKEAHGGEAVILNIGTPANEKSIRKGLAMGCDRAVQVVDPDGRASSPHAAATVLAEVLRQEAFDLILAGTQSDDLSYAQTGVVLAELLGLPHATIVMEVDAQPGKGSIKALREMESGSFQWVELPLPALLAIQAGSSQIRYPSLKGIMQARKKEIRRVDIDELNIPWAEIPRIDIRRLYMPQATRHAEILAGDASTVAKTLVQKLRAEAKVI